MMCNMKPARLKKLHLLLIEQKIKPVWYDGKVHHGRGTKTQATANIQSPNQTPTPTNSFLLKAEGKIKVDQTKFTSYCFDIL